ncbi:MULTISPECIES: ArsR/SmtB family transcription factor [Stappiaceae]|jgi:ArsR family transcriptional regulator|uniref:ArsR/SmtB family transcription factor n=1 Tax=Stappiaceae TaxID=2821832 RepID=UPI001ADB2333|nr:metalloregulator ArsR/SmtB family transcription factor [Labrenzia sp. R4_2]MBO9418750.1 helix-turn-helix transcriptional regulator [Labrenzia sp. R4_2]
MSDQVCPHTASGENASGLSGCESLAAQFRALGHPARLAILRRLAGEKEACCGEIVSALPLAQSTVSQHLQVLKDAGFLTCDTRGRNCHYVLNWDQISKTQEASDAFWKLLNSEHDHGVLGAVNELAANE